MIHGGVDIQVIDCLDDLMVFEPEWNAVQNACEHKHFGLDHRWLTLWWRHFGRAGTMHTLVLRRGGVVDGIVPLVLSRGWEAFPSRNFHVKIADDFRYLPSMRWRRFVPIRRLTFPLSLPSGSVRLHLLLRRADPRLIEAVLFYCRKISDRWDVLVLDGIPKGSEQANMLLELGSSYGLRLGRSRHSRALMRTSLPGTMEAFLASRSGNFRRHLRKNIRQNIERTADLGEFRIRAFRGSSINEGMDKLFDLELRSWKVKKSRKRSIYLSLNAEHQCFYRDVANAFALTDEAQVLVTEVGGQPANALFSLERDGITWGIQTYRAEEFSERVTMAPLWERFIESAIERGLLEIDFNGGNSNLMKYADGMNEFSRIFIYNPRFYSSLLRIVADSAHWVSQTFTGHKSDDANTRQAGWMQSAKK